MKNGKKKYRRKVKKVSKDDRLLRPLPETRGGRNNGRKGGKTRVKIRKTTSNCKETKGGEKITCNQLGNELYS